MANEAIVVLGMHRSGTSAVAGALGLAGLQLPARTLPAQEDNPRGFFEPVQIVALNDRALRLGGTQWYGTGVLGAEAFAGEESDRLVDQIVEALAGEYPGPQALVLKDPRLCRLVPLWQRAFAKAGMAWRAVLPLREPFEVAGSLRSRQGFPLDFGLVLWLRYVLDAEHASRGAPRLFIRYHDLARAPAAVVDRIGAALVEGWQGLTSVQEQELARFVDPSLNQQAARQPRRRPPAAFASWLADTEAAHGRLLADPDDGEARQVLDRVRSEFDADMARFAPLFTNMAETINKLTASARGELPPPGWQRSLARLARSSLRRFFEGGS